MQIGYNLLRIDGHARIQIDISQYGNDNNRQKSTTHRGQLRHALR